MAHADAATVAQHWADRMNAAGQRITDGVNNTKVAPGQLAARQQQAYLAGVQAKVTKWAQKVSGVSLAAWQDAMKNKGVNRVGSGATAALPKMQTFLSKLLPIVDTGRSSLPARGTYDQNKQRAIAWMDYMHKQTF